MGNTVICVTDLETTSLNIYNAEIIEGHFLVLNDNLDVVSEFDLKCNPLSWSDDAEKVHKITRQQAAKYERFSMVYQNLINWLKAYDIKEMWMHTRPDMFGKLTPYDYAVLRLQMSYQSDDAYWTINSIKPYSTLTLAKIYNDSYQFGGYSLDLVCNRLGIELNHHNAKSDCYAAYEILKRLLKKDSRELIKITEERINDNEGTSRINSKKSRTSKSAGKRFQST